MDLSDFFGPLAIERPNHPDFWRLSNIILQYTGEVEANAENPEAQQLAWTDFVGRVGDVHSLTYMATQRVMRAFGRPTPETVTICAAAATLWLEGFYAGARFEQAGGDQPGTVPDND